MVLWYFIRMPSFLFFIIMLSNIVSAEKHRIQKCINTIPISDISSHKFDAIADICIFLTFNQHSERLSSSIRQYYFHWNQLRSSPDKKSSSNAEFRACNNKARIRSLPMPRLPYSHTMRLYKRRGFYLPAKKLFVVLCQLRRNLIENIQYPCLVHATRVFSDIFLIVSKQLTLYFQRAFKRSFLDIFPHNSRHSAQNAII